MHNKVQLVFCSVEISGVSKKSLHYGTMVASYGENIITAK